MTKGIRKLQKLGKLEWRHSNPKNLAKYEKEKGNQVNWQVDKFSSSFLISDYLTVRREFL